MIDSIFFVDTKGRLLLGRNYCDTQCSLDSLAKSYTSHAGQLPCFYTDQRHFIHTTHNSISGTIITTHIYH